DVRPAKNAIDVVLDDRSIARAKPAVTEGSASCVQLAPVFRENAWSANFDLTRCSLINRLAIFSNKPNLDARQRLPDAARYSLAAERVRQRHANFSHTVTLQQCVAANFLPALERAHRQ